MAFNESIYDNVERVSALVGEKLGTITGYISTQILHENVQEKVRSTFSDALGRVNDALNNIDARSAEILENASSEFTDTLGRVNGVLNKIDAKSVEILEDASSELKQLPGIAMYNIGKIAKQADERFSLTVQQGTFYAIDFAVAVKSSFADLRK
jgi:hypothetical protein